MWPFNSKTKQLQQELEATKMELSQVKNMAGDSFPLSDSSRFQEFFGGGPVAAGQIVNHNTALRSSAVYACIRLISAAVSCAPVKIYKRDGDLRVRNATHPLSDVLRISPNRFNSAATFWKAFMFDKLLMGNAYAHIVKNRNNQPVALMPVKSWNVVVYYAWQLGLDKQPGVEKNRLFYGVLFDDGNYKVFDQADMLHVPNVGWDGKGGISTIRAMTQAVGLALGADQSSASFFANGLQTQSVISFDGTLDPDAQKRLRQHLEDRYTGATNHHKPLILFNNAKTSSLAMTAADAQLLESRKFSVIDICRFFGVHPVMIGENEKTSSFGGGVEQMGRWFNTLTLNEHFTAIEQELELKLFGDGNYAEFDESEITRGDMAARAEYYKAALGSVQQPGWLTQNEVRTEEGHAPITGGTEDELFTPESAAPAQPPAPDGGTK